MFTYLPKEIKGNSQKKKRKFYHQNNIKGKTQDQVVLGLLSYLWNWILRYQLT